jgi:hypothetical protein
MWAISIVLIKTKSELESHIFDVTESARNWLINSGFIGETYNERCIEDIDGLPIPEASNFYLNPDKPDQVAIATWF